MAKLSLENLKIINVITTHFYEFYVAKNIKKQIGNKISNPVLIIFLFVSHTNFANSYIAPMFC